MIDHLKDEDLLTLCAYLDGEEDESMCKAILTHLEECPACRALANTLMKTITLYRETDQCIEMSEEVRDRLYSCLDMEDLA